MATTVACLTPAGRGAIAVLGVRGPKAWSMLGQLFRPARGPLPQTPRDGQTWFGLLGLDLRDEVIVVARGQEPELEAEIHCHGGPAVVEMLLEHFRSLGAETRTWEQYLGGGLLVQMAHAPTLRTASILLDQHHGAYTRALGEIAALETGGQRDLAAIRRARLEALRPLAAHLVRPWRVVLCGAPNVGKSSIKNALAGYARSLVDARAGTTRDVVTTQLAIEGWPVELADTAGLREGAQELEEQGIARARQQIAGADLCCWVLDGTQPTVMPAEARQWLWIINKVDLPPGWDYARMPDAVRVSALTRTGIEELCERISRHLVPDPPAPGEAVPVGDFE